jgi:DNA adenine methylase
MAHQDQLPPFPDPEFEHAPSPLIYPGGKSRAIPIIVPLILEGMRRARADTLVSPFLGGGNLEVTCARQGVQVFASDLFAPLVCFWEHLLEDPEGLAEAVHKYLSANVAANDNAFKQLQQFVPKMPDGLERAAAFYVVNRLSYLGLTLNGGRSYSARFSPSGIEKLRSFSAPGLTVQNVDFRQALLWRKTAFGYFDPPYEFADEGRNRLYGVNGDAHRGFDHNALFKSVSDRPNWIMSLNADDHVLDRYKDFPKAFPRWSYGMSTNSESNEVLIFSRNLADLAGVARTRIAAATDAQRRRQFPANDNAALAAAWETPDLSVLSETATAAPPFPKAVLGGAWSPWCVGVAAAANAPLDYVAMALMTAAAGVIGNSLTVRATSGFVQPSVLWMCCVGKSGSGKTPAMNAVSDIVDALDSQSSVRQRLRQVTVAASVKLAAENPKGLTLFRDELSGLWSVIRRSDGEDFWLEAFNGKPFSKDRENRDPVHIDRLSISVIGGAQPATVKGVTTDGKNRGFSSRYLFGYPDPVQVYAGENYEIDTAWATAALGRLRDLPVAAACIPLSADAQAIFRDWWDRKKREAADHDGLWAEWVQKQGGNALRLALCLEMLKWSATERAALPDEIATQTLQDAVTLIDDWAIPMAQRTLDLMYRSGAEQHAATLAKHLRREKLAKFNARLLWRGSYGPAGALRDAKVLEEACRVLTDAGLIRHVGTRNHSHKGRVSGDYEVNPVLLASRPSDAH